METIQVRSSYPGTQIVELGEGPVLIQNGDITTTIYLGDDNTVNVNNPSQNVPLTAQSFVVFDGTREVWAIAASGTVLVYKLPSSLSFFQSGITGNQFFINKLGLFVYSTPLPSLGALEFSISPALVDSVGNAVFPGISAYSGVTRAALNGTGLDINSNGHDIGGLFYDTAGSSPLLYLHATAFAQLCSDTITAINPASPDNAEPWHTLSLAAGWSTVAGQPIPSYRLLPDGNVQLTGVVTHAAFSATTALSTAGALPAAYRPSTIMVVNGNSLTESPAEVTVSGLVNAFPGGTSCTTCRFNGIYPTNL